MNRPTSTRATRRINDLVEVFGVREVATKLGISSRTIERWCKESTSIPNHVELALDSAYGKKFSIETSAEHVPNTLSFIDLFAGIGGIRQGLQSAGASCVFTSEWDKYAAKTYLHNFDSSHQITGDITKVSLDEIPNHDILAAGFPCQPFSLAGVSKKNALGRKHGFLDETQGTLFFNVAEIIAEKRPKAFLLENVKNLLSHDKGNTFRVIQKVLAEELGYSIQYKVIDAKQFVPQHRERIYIVGFRDGHSIDWDKVQPNDHAQKNVLRSILHPEDGSEISNTLDDDKYIDPRTGIVHSKYTLSDGLWSYLKSYAEKHKAAGNGFGYGLVTPEMTSRTLSARYYKDGSEILVSQGPNKNPRRLTPRECARLMGFPESFAIPVSDTQAYKQFGNSVAVPVVAAVAGQLVQSLK